ncbi:ribonuclease H-like superfamily protein, partial [Striga asiatica]
MEDLEGIDIADQLQRFELSSEEKSGVALEEEDVVHSGEECKLSLFGRIFGNKKVNLTGLRRTLGLVLRTSQPLEVKEMESNCYQFIFRVKIGRIFHMVKDVQIQEARRSGGRVLRLLHEKLCENKRSDIAKGSFVLNQYGEWLRASHGWGTGRFNKGKDGIEGEADVNDENGNHKEKRGVEVSNSKMECEGGEDRGKKVVVLGGMRGSGSEGEDSEQMMDLSEGLLDEGVEMLKGVQGRRVIKVIRSQGLREKREKEGVGSSKVGLEAKRIFDMLSERVEEEEIMVEGSKKKRFYFDRRWLGWSGVKEVVEGAWGKSVNSKKDSKLKNGSFELEKEDENQYWLWKCWAKAGKFLERGLRIRIGDGKDTSIWNDPWIPTNAPFKLGLEKVSQLMRAEGGWNKQLIEDVFQERDVTTIMKIKPDVEMRPDEVVWHFDPKGRFSVKSAYRMIRQHEKLVLDRPEGSRTREKENKLWSRVWALKIKNKLKLFLWNCIKNILPTTDNLWRRKVKESNVCEVCGEQGETMEHISFPVRGLLKFGDWLLCFGREGSKGREILGTGLGFPGALRLRIMGIDCIFLCICYRGYGSRAIYGSEMGIMKGAWGEWLEFCK